MRRFFLGRGPPSLGSSRRLTAASCSEYVRRFRGHCNTQTDIKEASFWGPHFIISGSDDGCVYIWHKGSGRLLNVLRASEEIINCVQGNPNACLLATSGIDSQVQLFGPDESKQQMTEAEMTRLCDSNEDRSQSEIPWAFMPDLSEMSPGALTRYVLSLDSGGDSRSDSDSSY